MEAWMLILLVLGFGAVSQFMNAGQERYEAYQKHIEVERQRYERDVCAFADGFYLGIKRLITDKDFKAFIENGGQVKIDGNNNIIISGNDNRILKQLG